MPENDQIRILRVIEYSGPREAVESQVANSIHVVKVVSTGVVIKAATIGAFPEVLDEATIVDGEAERFARRERLLEDQISGMRRELAELKGEVGFLIVRVPTTSSILKERPMSLYNLLFGKNPMTAVLLATIGLKENDIERFRDVFVDDESDELRIIVHTRTGGGNRDDYPNEMLRLSPGFIRSEDDDGDCTYANDYFSVPAEFADDIRNFPKFMEVGIRPEFAQHLAKTMNREPTESDIAAKEYVEEKQKLARTSHQVLNGHTFVPIDDQAMKTALEAAEANGGELKAFWGIFPGVINVRNDFYAYPSAEKNNDLTRVETKADWKVDMAYWRHCQDKWSDEFPKAMEKIKESVGRHLERA